MKQQKYKSLSKEDILKRLKKSAAKILKDLKIPVEWITIKDFQDLINNRSKPKIIYTITTMKFAWQRVPEGPKKGTRYYGILRSRVVAWYETKQMCIDEILHNSGDIYEDGYYPVAVVEEVPMGLYPYCGNSWWFHWKKKVGYKSSRKPKSEKSVVNFAIG